MSMIKLLAAAIAAGGTKGLVTLSGEPISDVVDDPANAECGIRFNASGSVQQFDTPSYSTIDGATDWIIPNGHGALEDYEVRYVSLVGDDFTTKAAAENAWVSISTNPVWKLLQSVVGTSSNTCTFEIRNGADVTQDTGAYSFSSTVDSGA